MNRRTERPSARSLSICVILTLLVLVSGSSSAQTRDVATFIVETAKLTASDGAEDDSFGTSVAISSDTLVIGADRDDDSGYASGSAYVFGRDEDGSGTWTQVAKLTASDAAESDHFGSSVSISVDTVVVGVTFGSAYVFERDEGGPGNWGEVAKLAAFGRSVSISGDTVVVGAPEDDDSGSAYIFERGEGGPGNWGQVAKLTASDGASGDDFGWSVSISGDTIVIGAKWDDPGGSVYLFEKPLNGWDDMTETTKLTPSDGASGDDFGWSVSISNYAVIVGAPEDDANDDNSGSAYLFEKPESGWPATMTETTKLTASDGTTYQFLGLSVSISGDTAVAGAQLSDSSGIDFGSAYLFEKPESGWPESMLETGNLTASDGARLDCFGRSVSISGHTVVSGAPWADVGGNGDQGATYVFRLFEPVAWLHLPVVLRSAP